MAEKTVVALLFGGRSSEHSISCATAGGVLAAIDRSLYEVIPIGITPDGAFVLEADDPARFALDASAMPSVADNGTRVRWPSSSTSRELTVQDADGSVRSLGDVDVVFPILHGPWGEDGTVQGLLELVGLPYVGSGVLASALGMDKHFTKTVLAAAGIAVAPWQTVTALSWATSPAEVQDAAAAALALPVFVKPARAGSSVGVSKVKDWSTFAAAMEVAFAEDDKVLVEEGIEGREVECGVLGSLGEAEPRASVAGEVVMTGREFYDFDAKYLGASGIELVCPAALTDAELAEMQQQAVLAFTALGCAGLARVDFFLTPTGFVVNEVNTMPGFTPISMFPACWIATGVTYPALITHLLALALE
ncbi:D-alanine--D-alanine ligase family protein [Subtercola boreus]|uniref:D-alanine--D-alanine ligase n=1 Tax=Subtercola boreus TaxID=120213 RepID=A0A3E0WCB0_9MICO|nr:D-alanine--D-alanine ligase family protein [Subtercola boreus]RFA22384.1 D-alanine--D-alanine ligase [Subtercola boreus]RFA22446.1 D-alanine--D-alanine ligase [Subtercola boreus]RFA28461.1 D-alanine--D-alanine ligase [Subtercola boreus]